MNETTTAADPAPATLELAQILFLQNVAFSRGMGLYITGAWSDQHPNTRQQFISLAEASRQFAALDHFPAEAMERPTPVPPFLDRLADRAQAALLDRACWIWLFIAFWLGRLL